MVTYEALSMIFHDQSELGFLNEGCVCRERWCVDVYTSRVPVK